MALANADAGFSGDLDDGVLRRNQSVDAVWDYLADCLLSMAGHAPVAAPTTSERRLTDALFDELLARVGDRPFYFAKDPGEAGGRSADLDARPRDGASFVIEGRRFNARERFLVLEAKRLPAPERSREREYLVGNHGGVERFKRGLHAHGVTTVGMIGYLQSHDATHWHSVVNGWVDELAAGGGSAPTWDSLDRLVVERHEFPAPLASFTSAPLREPDGRRLSMRHLWARVPTPPRA